jgi:hypothetical protein
MQGCFYQNGLADRVQGGMAKVYWQQLLFTFSPSDRSKILALARQKYWQIRRPLQRTRDTYALQL